MVSCAVDKIYCIPESAVGRVVSQKNVSLDYPAVLNGNGTEALIHVFHGSNPELWSGRSQRQTLEDGAKVGGYSREMIPCPPGILQWSQTFPVRVLLQSSHSFLPRAIAM